LRQQRERLPDCAPSTQQSGTIECVVNLDSKFRAITESFLDPFPQVPDGKHDMTQAMPPQKCELMPEKGMASNLDQRFGNILGKRPQARGQSSGQDNSRHELHQVTQPGPSRMR